MADLTIRERLDKIVTDVNGIIFDKSEIDGWTVYKSATGLKYAVTGIDYVDIVWTTELSTFGMFICDRSFNEPIPSGIFTVPPMVSINVVIPDSTYIAVPYPVLPPSVNYVGENKLVAVDYNNTTTSRPKKIHVIYTAIGF